uniref:Putative secreted protein n=1 Tax=Xenopsylla cheopis TaxID=163159 RepID=A0A6M2E097_XENCH
MFVVSFFSMLLAASYLLSFLSLSRSSLDSLSSIFSYSWLIVHGLFKRRTSSFLMWFSLNTPHSCLEKPLSITHLSILFSRSLN